MLKKSHPLLVTIDSIRRDPALQPHSRGARKIGVTTVYPDKEKEYSEPRWIGSDHESPVMLLESTEYAVFTETTVQDRHFHKMGTEFYTILEGEFHIDVSGDLFQLTAGDSIVIPAGVVHEVFRDTSFVASVITVHCGGIADKYIE